MKNISLENVGPYFIAIMLLLGGFYGLLRPGSAADREIQLVCAGLITAVSTWAFQRQATKDAATHTIEAQNNGIDQIRQTVSRLESGQAILKTSLARAQAEVAPNELTPQ